MSGGTKLTQTQQDELCTKIPAPSSRDSSVPSHGLQGNTSPPLSHNRPSTSCSHWPHADRCCSFSSFLIPTEILNSCPMACAPLTDLTPVEAHRGLAWLHVRHSPGCLSILASSPRLTELQDFVQVGCHQSVLWGNSCLSPGHGQGWKARIWSEKG